MDPEAIRTFAWGIVGIALIYIFCTIVAEVIIAYYEAKDEQ
jgi:hypothetical protein